MVICDAGGTTLPAGKLCAVTVPVGGLLGLLTVTFKPTAWSAPAPALHPCPTALGTVTFAGPLDTVIFTVVPLGVGTPPAGSVLITLPSATLLLGA
jgi:hypothetical protein